MAKLYRGVVAEEKRIQAKRDHEDGIKKCLDQHAAGQSPSPLRQSSIQQGEVELSDGLNRNNSRNSVGLFSRSKDSCGHSHHKVHNTLSLADFDE